MKTQKFDLEMHDGRCDCFSAEPGDGKKHPGVLLLMDGFGPRAYLYEMAEKLASNGYFVLLPNLFYRIRRAPVIDASFPITEANEAEARQQLMSLFTKYDFDAGLRDVHAFLDHLERRPEVKSGKMGLTGYCMGGWLSIRGAEQEASRVAAAASFHAGRLANDQPSSPHRFLNEVRGRLYIAHADADASMPPEQIDRLRDALEKSGVRFKAEVYEGAKHGFTMKDLPAYNEAALERHWRELLPLLKAELQS